MHARTGAITAAALALVLVLSGCQTQSGKAEGPGPAHENDTAERAPGANPAHGAEPSPLAARTTEIPGLGPKTRQRMGLKTRQALVVRAEGADANQGTAVLYERDSAGAWRPASDIWPTRNGVRGWTEHHRQGDLRTPIGVYGLTDAGGLLKDPGTKLPYDQGPGFTPPNRTNVEGEPLTGAFDYVVAVNYNRVAGHTPLSWTRPLGDARGGGIWLHVEHGAGTQGCVGLPRERMKELLRRLDPAAEPVVVMGPVAALAA
ncbi:L,D-transpeptidase family protein [Streptomyces sp. NPDC059076]|uniref:L,D-transpeptidase family protein n=1 Tax=unclassified Streptomyces TaxID=2593676 RepID=UPI0036977B25